MFALGIDDIFDALPNGIKILTYDTAYILGLDVERKPKAVLLSQKFYIKQVAADYSEVVKKYEGVPNISAAGNRMLAAQRATANGEDPPNNDSCGGISSV